MWHLVELGKRRGLLEKTELILSPRAKEMVVLEILLRPC